MQINKKLKDAVSFDPTNKVHQMTIENMCKKIELQTLSLPLYQRDLSWTLQKCIDLFNYQLLGKAPVSPISINVINDVQNCVPQVSFIDRGIISDVKRGQYSIVDGQQRLTTNFKAYSNHEDFEKVVLDLSRGSFSEIKSFPNENQIPVGVLMNKNDSALFQYIRKRPKLSSPEVVNLLILARNKIKKYNYTINSAEDLSEDEQIEWFEVLNNAGSRVSIIQMRFSKLKVHGIDIYKQYTNPFVDKLVEAGYEDLFIRQQTIVSYPIAALNPAYERITGREHSNNYAPIPSDTKENQLCNLAPGELTKCFDWALEALDKVLDFINVNDLCEPTRIEYINYLLGYFIFNGYELTERTTRALCKWWRSVDFRDKSNSERRDIFNELIVLR